MSKVNTLYLEDLMFARAEWLGERGYKEGDVMSDGYSEYVMTFDESEGVYGPMKKMHLPKEIQL